LILKQLDSIGNPIFKPIKGIKPQGKPWTLFQAATPPQADGVLKIITKTGPKHVMVIFVPLTLGTLGTLNFRHLT
jgi:hypothetical protein